MLEPAPGKKIADRYRLERQLGEGGMGSVWGAHDEKLRRDVAVKLVTERIADSERALGRFEREAMAVARLRSPHIAQVYDYGVEDGSPYIIMELLEGEDLKDMLSREKRLSLEATARLVLHVAKALHAAHAEGIVHRDLKPANVFISREHDEEVIKVFDFGVAKALNDLADGEATAEGVLLGTPRYMSPEQAHGAKEVDHRSDLWSLGVIAYRAVCGRLPFTAVGTGHVLVQICTEDPPKPSEIIGHLPAAVDAFFARALHKNPAERFDSAREMGLAFADLAEVSLSSFAVGGAPPTPSWGGLAGPPSDEGSFGPSLEISGVQMPSARRDDSTSVDGSVARGRGPISGVSADDGTLGPATTTVDGGWLATRGARVGALFAALIVGAVLAFFVLRPPAEGDPAAAGQLSAAPAISSPTAESSAAPEPSASIAAGPPEPAESASAAARNKPAAQPKEVVAKPQPSAAKTAAADVPPADPPKHPPPPPKSTGKGDGLDLFNRRF